LVTAQCSDEVHAAKLNFDRGGFQAANCGVTRSTIETSAAILQKIDAAEFVGGIAADAAREVFAFEDLDEELSEGERVRIGCGLNDSRQPSGIGMRGSELFGTDPDEAFDKWAFRLEGRDHPAAHRTQRRRGFHDLPEDR